VGLDFVQHRGMIPILRDVTVGRLKLRAPATWSFVETDGLVVGRTEARLGSLRIKLPSGQAVRSDATAPDGHAMLTSWLEAKRPLVVARHGGGSGVVELAGSEGMGRAWWHVSPGGLMLAQYRTRVHSWTPVTKAERDEAEAIVLSARLTSA
jgi:hypothetical protein